MAGYAGAILNGDGIGDTTGSFSLEQWRQQNGKGPGQYPYDGTNFAWDDGKKRRMENAMNNSWHPLYDPRANQGYGVVTSRQGVPHPNGGYYAAGERWFGPDGKVVKLSSFPGFPLKVGQSRFGPRAQPKRPGTAGGGGGGSTTAGGANQTGGAGAAAQAILNGDGIGDTIGSFSLEQWRRKNGHGPGVYPHDGTNFAWDDDKKRRMENGMNNSWHPNYDHAMNSGGSVVVPQQGVPHPNGGYYAAGERWYGPDGQVVKLSDFPGFPVDVGQTRYGPGSTGGDPYPPADPDPYIDPPDNGTTGPPGPGDIDWTHPGGGTSAGTNDSPDMSGNWYQPPPDQSPPPDMSGSEPSPNPQRAPFDYESHMRRKKEEEIARRAREAEGEPSYPNTPEDDRMTHGEFDFGLPTPTDGQTPTPQPGLSPGLVDNMTQNRDYIRLRDELDQRSRYDQWYTGQAGTPQGSSFLDWSGSGKDSPFRDWHDDPSLSTHPPGSAYFPSDRTGLPDPLIGAPDSGGSVKQPPIEPSHQPLLQWQGPRPQLGSWPGHQPGPWPYPQGGNSWYRLYQDMQSRMDKRNEYDRWYAGEHGEQNPYYDWAKPKSLPLPPDAMPVDPPPLAPHEPIRQSVPYGALSGPRSTAVDPSPVYPEGQSTGLVLPQPTAAPATPTGQEWIRRTPKATSPQPTAAPATPTGATWNMGTEPPYAVTAPPVTGPEYTSEGPLSSEMHRMEDELGERKRYEQWYEQNYGMKNSYREWQATGLSKSRTRGALVNWSQDPSHVFQGPDSLRLGGQLQGPSSLNPSRVQPSPEQLDQWQARQMFLKSGRIVPRNEPRTSEVPAWQTGVGAGVTGGPLFTQDPPINFNHPSPGPGRSGPALAPASTTRGIPQTASRRRPQPIRRPAPITMQGTSSGPKRPNRQWNPRTKKYE